MGMPQQEFLARLRAALTAGFSAASDWSGGQIASNCASLAPVTSLRRNGPIRSGERFELGDLRCRIGSVDVVVEYESEGVALHNLLKYWPYLRGEMSSRPSSPILLCHFSNWSSYGSYRDLWEWTAARMTADPALLVKFAARQFDHWGAELDESEASMAGCVEWLKSEAFCTAADESPSMSNIGNAQL